MSTFLSISITGHVGNTPEIRYVGDKPVASFSVAVNRTTRNGEQQTLWVRANCWGKLSQVAMNYVKRGSQVQLTTEWVRPSAWIDNEGNPQASLDIDVNRLILLGGTNGNYSEEDEIPI